MNSSFQVRYYIKIIDPEIGQLPKTFKRIAEKEPFGIEYANWIKKRIAKCNP